jgi:Na+/proline symporter
VVLLAGSVTVIYSATSGLWGVVVTDLLLFVISMVGSVAAAWYALAHPDVGGLAGLLSHPAVQDKSAFLPDFSDGSAALSAFVIPLAVQWWSAWYPGAEPGGGGYVAQRMLAARNESGALAATLWFNMAHYALRPWPWILVALASLVVYPDLAALGAAFPRVDPAILRNDLAYPAMLVFLPHGLLGLVVASLAAAYMSTISTHLNWGASYVVDDLYRRFLAPERSERHYVTIGRITTVALILLSSALALWLENAYQAFRILLQIGAGTGLVFLLRWFWWRVNAWSEISAMVVSFLVAVYFQFGHEALGFARWDSSLELVAGVALTTVGWLAVTFLTPPTGNDTLVRFHDSIRPGGPGWRAVAGDATRPAGVPADASMTSAVGAWFLGCVVVYGALFGTGYLLYGEGMWATACFMVAAIGTMGLVKLLPGVSVLD